MTLSEIRIGLGNAGYAGFWNESGTISLHLHPLITNPIALVGSSDLQALPYQEKLYSEAIKRR